MNAFSKIISLGVIACLCIPGEAQINNSVYFMPGVPQANRVNPAHQPNCGSYIGFPMLAPMRLELSSSSLSYQDVIYPHPFQDSLITFLHSAADKEAFLNKLEPENFIVTDLRSSLISLGLQTEIGFLTFDLTSRVDGAVYYPGDLAKLLLKGSIEGETYSLDGIGTNLSAFDELSLGWSYPFLDNLQVGVRAKMLFGIGDLSTRRSELSITTSEEAWNIQSDLMVSASLPFAEVVYNEEGMIEDIVIDEEIESLRPTSLPRYIFNYRNPGFAVDLGVNYRPIDQLLLSASAVDIGFISWKDEVHDATHAMEYEYLGFELNPLELNEDYSLGDYIDSSFSQLGDSLLSFLEFTPGRAYSKRLNTKLYVGASYFVTPNINFGLLSRTDFLQGLISQQFTASANFTTGRWINLTLSYTYKNSYMKNLGAGISFNAGPLNLYLISDNTLNALFWPQEARSVNLWFGMNVVFGYKQCVKVDGDRPLVY
ncbi:MAG: DUF5723 family protein [Bacteroidota bacterium]